MVVSDTSAICYLLLIDHIDLIPRMFGCVVAPESVIRELSCEGAPPAVSAWVSCPPEWLSIRQPSPRADPSLDRLQPGERDAILLAEEIRADLVVLDEKAARELARQRGLNVTGLLGILREAARLDLVDLPSAIDRLRQTTFRASPRLFKCVLESFGDIE